MKPVRISVIVPTHNPDANRLRSTLRGLRAQSLPAAEWETIIVDNRSAPPIDMGGVAGDAPENVVVIRESRLGLTPARIAGFRRAAGSLIVMVDDDNVLAPTYISEVLRLFEKNPGLGAAGGRSIPVFETAPEPWQSEFYALLAVRDLGGSDLVAEGFGTNAAGTRDYPAFAPIGAGMALRLDDALRWAADVESDDRRRSLDRSGRQLVSGGDNDIVMTILESGRNVGYFPSLSLEHLIPAARIDPKYLARLNRAIQRSWIQVLSLHGANPWKAISPWSALPRKIKAYFASKAWKSPRNKVEWNGICGRIEGLATLARTNNR